MPKVPYPYEVNGKFVRGNGSLIPICSLSNCSLLPSLTVLSLFLERSQKHDQDLKKMGLHFASQVPNGMPNGIHHTLFVL